jgi:hypothetical protein
MRNGLAGGVRFRLELTEERGPDAAVAELGQQGDVDDADLAGPAGDVEPPDGSVEKDDVEAGIGVRISPTYG